MKMIIEISGGVVANIVSTDECEIFIVDHDNLKECGEEYQKQAYQPDCVTYEDTSDPPPFDETPEFDRILAEIVEPYWDETIYQQESERVGGGDTGLFCGVIGE